MAILSNQQLDILLADDDLEDCMLFDQALKEIEIPTQLFIVKDCTDLFEFLHKDPLPSFLFLDIGLPGRTGLQGLDEIRANTRFDNLPVIIYSTGEYSREASYQKGADLFISKPDSYADLLHILKSILSVKSLNELSRLKAHFSGAPDWN